MNNEIELMKAATKAHTNDALSGDYTFLHFTPENENTYKQGFMKGVDYAASLLKLQTEEAPTVFRQNEPKIILDEENARTLHY